MPAPLSLIVQRRYIDFRTTVSNPYLLEAKINRAVKTALSASYTSVLDMLFGGMTLSHAYVRNELSNGYEITDDVFRRYNDNGIIQYSSQYGSFRTSYSYSCDGYPYVHPRTREYGQVSDA